MWETIKAKISEVLGYVAFALGFVAYFLFLRDRKLSGELEHQKAQNSVENTEGKKDEIDQEAADSSASYDELKSEFLGGSGDVPAGNPGGGQEPAGQAKTD